ncbi:Smr/MutS family protein [Roseomonas sp. NAR14]|uniref:Smr/MutS family protein n=1 Tax=Roseomonas acroporae TaxID=2937791 RepID=A0A9X2BVE5_9PROT|nr:Smr/MutS family protein [Roseomonas acroporae]MCK8783929.1 Smr/MutS family protein [Roseomonas acroporae]
MAATGKPRRARGLSEADRALWLAYASRVTPLRGRAPPPAPAAPPAAPEAPAPAPAPGPTPAAPAVAPKRRGGMGEAPISIGEAPGGLDAQRWRDLRRGRLRPERTLDLHGRTAAEAHHAVRSFLALAQAEGLRCVAVVTGKGSSGGGVIRREFLHWLNAPDLRPLLLGAAHPHAANTGAVHLLLRRRKAPGGR